MIQFPAHRLKFLRRQNRRYRRRERLGNDPMGGDGVRSVANCAKLRDCCTPPDETSEEVHETINDSPCKVAADRADEQCANFLSPCLVDADRAGEGKNHEILSTGSRARLDVLVAICAVGSNSRFSPTTVSIYRSPALTRTFCCNPWPSGIQITRCAHESSAVLSRGMR